MLSGRSAVRGVHADAVSKKPEIYWSSLPLEFPGGGRTLETVLVLDDVAMNEFVCYVCRRSMKAQKTLVHVDRMGGKERRTGAYCVKCAYRVMREHLEKREGGKEFMGLLECLAVGAALSDEEVYVVLD